MALAWGALFFGSCLQVVVFCLDYTYALVSLLRRITLTAVGEVAAQLWIVDAASAVVVVAENVDHMEGKMRFQTHFQI